MPKEPKPTKISLPKLNGKQLFVRIQAYGALLILAAFSLHDFYTQAQHNTRSYVAVAGVIAVLLLVEKVIRVIK